MKLKAANNPLSAVIALIVLIAVAIGAYSIGHHRTNQPSNTPSVQKVSIKPSGLQYPSGWQEASQIPVSDQSSGVLSEASRNNPSASAIIYSHPLSKSEQLDQAADQVVSKLKSALSGFQLVSSKVTKVGQYQAIQINYKANTANGQFEYNQTIIEVGKKAYYLVVYSAPKDFPTLKSDVATLNSNFSAWVKP